MKTYLVVTLTCPDRPGVVDRITEVISEHAANWEESRMAHLGGEFAGIVKISVSEDKREALTEAIRALSDDEMTVVVKATQLAPSGAQQGDSFFNLQLTGADHEGIVHAVAHYLAGQGINLENMETKVVPTPISATPVFQMQSQIKVPASLSFADLSEHLDHIGHELGVDIEVSPSEE